ncbi:MAG: L-lactate dehydrogenase, partial [Rhodobacterales bacterium]|nr:L-lactate dehydrogenase [Rhodobacterales bacterium]
GLARMVRAIAADEGAVLSVSTLTGDIGGVASVTLSVPRVLGRKGITAELRPELDEGETRALAASARLLAETEASLHL